jgi:hypothetical protein
MMIRSVVVSMSSSLEFLTRSPGRGQGLRNCLYRLFVTRGDAAGYAEWRTLAETIGSIKRSAGFSFGNLSFRQKFSRAERLPFPPWPPGPRSRFQWGPTPKPPRRYDDG